MYVRANVPTYVACTVPTRSTDVRHTKSVDATDGREISKSTKSSRPLFSGSRAQVTDEDEPVSVWAAREGGMSIST